VPHVPQGNVAPKHVVRSVTMIDEFITNSLLCIMMEEFPKLVRVWQSYRQEHNGTFLAFNYFQWTFFTAII